LMREMVGSGAPGDVMRLQQREEHRTGQEMAAVSFINRGKATKIPAPSAFALRHGKCEQPASSQQAASKQQQQQHALSPRK